jgi:hypothetical protein
MENTASAKALPSKTPSSLATTTLTFTPGFRTHLGCNWYLLGGVEVPATNPKTFDYSILSGLMYVY